MNIPCPDCFTGTLRGDVVPRGREEILHGLPTYVTWPEQGVRPLGTVVIIPDAFGWKLLNTRALADVYAQRVPCIVYVPDFMNGHLPSQKFLTLAEYKPSPNASLLSKFISRLLTDIQILPHLLKFYIHNRPSKASPRIISFLQALRCHTISPAQSSPTPLAVAGFCWGGHFAIKLTHDIPQNKILFNPSGIPGVKKGEEWHLVDCVFTAHPSLVDVPADVEGIVWPVSIANGDDDEWMGRRKWEVVVGILEGKNKAFREGQRGLGLGTAEGEGEGGETGTDQGDIYQVKVYPGAKHGFAVRGDRDDPLQRERGWRSEDQAVRWFRRHFGGGQQGGGQQAGSIRTRTSTGTGTGTGSRRNGVSGSGAGSGVNSAAASPGIGSGHQLGSPLGQPSPSSLPSSPGLPSPRLVG